MAVLLVLLVSRLDWITPLHCSDACWPLGALMLLLTSSSGFQGLCSGLRKNTEELPMNPQDLDLPLVVGNQTDSHVAHANRSGLQTC